MSLESSLSSNALHLLKKLTSWTPSFSSPLPVFLFFIPNKFLKCLTNRTKRHNNMETWGTPNSQRSFGIRAILDMSWYPVFLSHTPSIVTNLESDTKQWNRIKDQENNSYNHSHLSFDKVFKSTCWRRQQLFKQMVPGKLGTSICQRLKLYFTTVVSMSFSSSYVWTLSF